MELARDTRSPELATDVAAARQLFGTSLSSLEKLRYAMSSPERVALGAEFHPWAVEHPGWEWKDVMFFTGDASSEPDMPYGHFQSLCALLAPDAEAKKHVKNPFAKSYLEFWNDLGSSDAPWLAAVRRRGALWRFADAGWTDEVEDFHDFQTLGMSNEELHLAANLAMRLCRLRIHAHRGPSANCPDWARELYEQAQAAKAAVKKEPAAATDAVGDAASPQGATPVWRGPSMTQNSSRVTQPVGRRVWERVARVVRRVLFDGVMLGLLLRCRCLRRLLPGLRPLVTLRRPPRRLSRRQRVRRSKRRSRARWRSFTFGTPSTSTRGSFLAWRARLARSKART